MLENLSGTTAVISFVATAVSMFWASRWRRRSGHIMGESHSMGAQEHVSPKSATKLDGIVVAHPGEFTKIFESLERDSSEMPEIEITQLIQKPRGSSDENEPPLFKRESRQPKIPVKLPTEKQSSPRRRSPSPVRPVMQVVVSLAFLGAAIFIILSPTFNGNDKHWAYGSAGTILGFWLKS